jgi:hypothetical protein
MDIDATHHSIGLIQERRLSLGPTLLMKLNQQCRIQDNLKVMRSRQESYANKRHQSLEFEVGDHIYLWVSPMKSVERFGMKGKLPPRYFGPFPILYKCGPVAYKLELLPSLVGVHDIFHVSQLKKCLKAPMDVVLPEVTARCRFNLSRSPNQDFGSEGLCH